MTQAPIARSGLTSVLVGHLVNALMDTEVIVGRGSAPPEGGWSGGQPGSGVFKPYVVVKTRPAVPWLVEGLGRQRQKDSWKCAYQFTTFHRLESKTDDAADTVRAAIATFPLAFELGGVDWTIQKIDFGALGATSKNDSTDPAYWEVTDDVSLWCSR